MKKETKFWLVIGGLIVVSAGVGLYFTLKAKNKKKDNEAMNTGELSNPSIRSSGMEGGSQANIGKTIVDSVAILFKKKPTDNDKTTTSYADTLNVRKELSDVPDSSSYAFNR